MVTSILKHVRSNLIAYLALFVALGGTGYAATSLPRGSVGPQQLNHRLIGGYVRAWARVNASSQLVGGSGGAKVVAGPPSGPLTIRWSDGFPRSSGACAAVVTPNAPGGGIGVYAEYRGHGEVQVSSPDGSLPGFMTVAVVC